MNIIDPFNWLSRTLVPWLSCLGALAEDGDGDEESEGRGMRSQVRERRNLFFFFVVDIFKTLYMEKIMAAGYRKKYDVRPTKRSKLSIYEEYLSFCVLSVLS